MLCALFLRPKPPASAEAPAGKPGAAKASAGNRLRAAYERSLGWALAHPAITLGLLAMTVALNGYLIATIPKGFFPQQDNGLMTGTIQASQSTSYQAMQGIIADDVRKLRMDPSIDSIVATSGGGSTSNQARMFISLK